MAATTRTRLAAKAIVLNAVDSDGRRLGDRDVAALVVKGLAAGDADDARTLLDMLGLVDWSTSPGTVRPEDGRILDIEGINGGNQEYMGGRMGEHQHEPPPRRYVHLLPPGLRLSAAERPLPKPPAEKAETHGDHAGRKRHERRGEPLCEECQSFFAAYQRERRERKRTAADAQPRNTKGRFSTGGSADTRTELPPPTITDKCGTLTGRSRHIRAGEQLCRACKDAANANAAERRKAKAAGKPKRTRPRPPCGSPGGSRSHRRHGEPVCEPCRLAQQEVDRGYHEGRKMRDSAQRQEDAA